MHSNFTFCTLIIFIFSNIQNKDAKSSLFKSPVPHTGVPFVPKVTSTANMNTNFSTMKSPGASRAASKRASNTGKENVRKSPRITPGKKSVDANAEPNRKSVGNVLHRKIAVAATNRKSLSSSVVGGSRKSNANVETKRGMYLCT